MQKIFKFNSAFIKHLTKSLNNFIFSSTHKLLCTVTLRMHSLMKCKGKRNQR